LPFSRNKDSGILPTASQENPTPLREGKVTDNPKEKHSMSLPSDLIVINGQSISFPFQYLEWAHYSMGLFAYIS
jgi:hypothetical protein